MTKALTTRPIEQDQSRTLAVVPARVGRFLYRLWRKRVSYLMLSPFLILFIVFMLYPIAWSAYLSLTEYRGIKTSPPEFVGLDNYKDLLSFTIRKEQPDKVETNEAGETMYTCIYDSNDAYVKSLALPIINEVPESTARQLEAEGIAFVTQEILDANPFIITEEQIENSDGSVNCEARLERRATLPAGYGEITRVNLTSGGESYIIGASNKRFLIALWNTFIYTFASVTLTTTIGLLLAVALQNQTRMNQVLRVIFFLPTITTGIAITVVWTWIFSGESYGMINTVLINFGIEKIEFLARPQYTMPILVWVSAWGGSGFVMLLFLAGLKNIPPEMYEAASIDGASVTQRFFGITLPMLRPTFVYVIITGIINSFQVFEAVYIMYRTPERLGGPLDSGLTVVPYLFWTGFEEFQLGYASAVAWVLFVIIFFITLINLRVTRANEAF